MYCKEILAGHQVLSRMAGKSATSQGPRRLKSIASLKRKNDLQSNQLLSGNEAARETVNTKYSAGEIKSQKISQVKLEQDKSTACLRTQDKQTLKNIELLVDKTSQQQSQSKIGVVDHEKPKSSRRIQTADLATARRR